MAAETVSGNGSRGEPSKACSKCGVVRLLGEFSRNRTRADGLQSACKPCCAAQGAAWRAENKVALREYGRRYRLENVEARREMARTYNVAHKEEGLARQRAWRASNTEKHCARNKAYYAADQEKYRARARAYYVANREAVLGRNRVYRKGNPEPHRAGSRRRYAKNPDLFSRYRHARRAMLAGAMDNQPFSRAEIWERDGGRCHACGKTCDPKSWHLDHLIPISRGGPNAPWNVAVAHPRCNLRRGNRGPAQLRLL